MKNFISILLMVFLIAPRVIYSSNYGELTSLEKNIITLGDNTCRDINEEDIPTIFIPGILASWYSKQGFEDNEIKRWIPDPVTHVYDPLIYTFKRDGYTIEDVFYIDDFNLKIEGDPKKSLYLFGYDWKKDNKITATLLAQLIGLIQNEYEKYHGCDIGKVNIVAHSMGGLVARSMLEDMCVELYDSKGKPYFPTTKVEGDLEFFKTINCSNPFTNKEIKVNNLITIATPHRGSPKALPIWEEGDIEATDGFQGTAIKFKVNGLLGLSNMELYKSIHGYNEKIPNGIVTIGQLLPDINNDNVYNDKLKYIYSHVPFDYDKDTYSVGDTYAFPNEFHPINSFLEELNRKENIDKMWDNIDGKFTLLYSNYTGNFNKNNIASFTLGFDDSRRYDNTRNIGEDVNDIYDYYEGYNDRFSKGYYSIDKVNRDSLGLGGDGTVPSYNSRLVPNDSPDGKEIANKKFESIEVKCKDNDIYDIFGEVDGEICNHTNMPTASSQKVLEIISGKVNDLPEQKSIVNNLGYAFYHGQDMVINDEGKEVVKESSFRNYDKFDDVFDEDSFKKAKKVEYKFGDMGVDWSKNGNYSLSLGSTLQQGLRLYSYEILSPVNLLITDSHGRRIGIDPDTGMIINEIPGAWTSGDTEGSGEPEIFIIPDSGTGVVDHKVETFGTGDGDYRIVINEVTDSYTGSTQAIIHGEAKKAFGEDYSVSIDEEVYFNNTTLDENLGIDVKDSYSVAGDLYHKLRYTVRGNPKGVEKISYKLIDSSGKELKSKTKDIDGIIDLEVEDYGEYKVKLDLLSSNSATLFSKEVDVNFKEKVSRSYSNNKTISTKKQLSFDSILESDFHGIFNIYNNKLNYIDSSLGYGLAHSFDIRLDYLDNFKNIEVLFPDGSYNNFVKGSDGYKGIIDNDLKLVDNVIFLEITKGDYIYKIDKFSKRLISINLREDEYLFDYNDSKLLGVDKNGEEFLSFEYNNNGLLDIVVDNYGNEVNFGYELVDGNYVLYKIAGESLDYNLDYDITRVNNLLDKLFKTNKYYKEKLNSIYLKLDSFNLSSSSRSKFRKIVTKYKVRILGNYKSEYNRELVKFYLDEIENYLKQ